MLNCVDCDQDLNDFFCGELEAIIINKRCLTNVSDNRDESEVNTDNAPKRE